MNDLTRVFDYQGRQVRTLIKDGEPWWVAKDVCEILDLGNVTRAVERLDDDEKGFTTIQTPGGPQEMNVVNEPGLYAMILTSRKPEARAFKHWITHEVLPTIRKTGGYVVNDDLFIKTYIPFADENTKALFRGTLEMVRKQNEIIALKDKQIEHKEAVIIGLVDEISLAEKRQVLNRVVRYKGANYRERWYELYKQFEMKYHIDLDVRLKAYNETHKPKLKNKVDYIDKVMNKIPELYEIACKLYENDVKELAKTLYSLNKEAM